VKKLQIPFKTAIDIKIRIFARNANRITIIQKIVKNAYKFKTLVVASVSQIFIAQLARMNTLFIEIIISI